MVTTTYDLMCLNCHPNGLYLGGFNSEQERLNVAFYHWKMFHHITLIGEIK